MAKAKMKEARAAEVARVEREITVAQQGPAHSSGQVRWRSQVKKAFLRDRSVSVDITEQVCSSWLPSDDLPQLTPPS